MRTQNNIANIVLNEAHTRGYSVSKDAFLSLNYFGMRYGSKQTFAVPVIREEVKRIYPTARIKGEKVKLPSKVVNVVSEYCLYLTLKRVKTGNILIDKMYIK